jgi:hypothetical protein
MPLPLARFAGFLGPVVLRAGQLALLLALSACVSASGRPPRGTAGGEALHQFSEEAYCPAPRLHAAVYDPAFPHPRAAVADDPERLAMWLRTMRARAAKQGARRVVVVEGCGEHAEFTCWEDGRSRYRMRREDPVCLETRSDVPPE